MKIETRGRMAMLGLELPKGWIPVDSSDGNPAAWNDVVGAVILKPEFELEVGGHTVPYEVLMALYLDAGVYALRSDEAQALTLSQQRNEVLQNNLSQQAHVVAKLRVENQRASVQNARRKVHFWALKEAREIIKKLGARIHRQRVKIKHLKAELERLRAA